MEQRQRPKPNTCLAKVPTMDNEKDYRIIKIDKLRAYKRILRTATSSCNDLAMKTSTACCVNICEQENSAKRSMIRRVDYDREFIGLPTCKANRVHSSLRIVSRIIKVRCGSYLNPPEIIRLMLAYITKGL